MATIQPPALRTQFGYRPNSSHHAPTLVRGECVRAPLTRVGDNASVMPNRSNNDFADATNGATAAIAGTLPTFRAGIHNNKSGDPI